MIPTKSFTLAFFLTLGTYTFGADTIMKPGLWELSSVTKTKSGQMESAMSQMKSQMASMPPEQRKMMEKMMASNGVGKSPKDNTITMCITKEDVQRNTIPLSDSRCKHDLLKRSGNSIHFKFSCKGEPSSSGEGDYTFNGSSAYKGNMTVHTRSQGHEETIQMTQSGKWLSDNCGKVKPIKYPKN